MTGIQWEWNAHPTSLTCKTTLPARSDAHGVTEVNSSGHPHVTMATQSIVTFTTLTLFDNIIHNTHTKITRYKVRDWNFSWTIMMIYPHPWGHLVPTSSFWVLNTSSSSSTTTQNGLKQYFWSLQTHRHMHQHPLWVGSPCLGYWNE